MFVQVVGAGLLIAVADPASAPAQDRGGRSGRRESKPIPLDARLHIAKDGAITVMTGKVDCGQGARAQITQAAAEELGVAVEKIGLVMGDTDLTPDDGITAGSRTTPSTIPVIRQTCAAARNLLESLSAKAGNALTYADLAAASTDSLKQAAPADVAVTAAKEWKILGTPVPRPNARDLVTGKHQYPYDITRPGMLYGKILRAPSYGAKLTAIDLAPAQAMKDVFAVRDGDFVAVTAPTTYAAKLALQAVEKTAAWNTSPHPSSKELYDHLRNSAKPVTNPFADELKSAASVHKATYRVPYVQHAPMEPRCALAEWENGKLTVWMSTQNPFGVRRELSNTFKLPEDRVRVIVADFGGGFGGKHSGETAVEAARLAQAAKKPVMVQWTRAEEFTWALFRPAGVMDAEATLDKNGAITSWHFININSGGSGVDSPYAIKKDCAFVQSDGPLRHGSYRALSATANNFARECFMDELADAAKRDPLEFRLAHLQDARLRAMLEEAAKKFGWADARAAEARAAGNTIGIGVACGTEKGSFVAACAEVIADRVRGTITVKRIVQAFECGAIMNPANLRSQVEGAIIMALGPTFNEAMEFEGGKMLNASFAKYRVPREHDVPRIEIHLLDRPDLPSGGAGEIPLIAAAPAIANAVFHATGVRLRDLPLKLPKVEATPVPSPGTPGEG
jgi:isoquinoline 1-oxidoreductase